MNYTLEIVWMAKKSKNIPLKAPGGATKFELFVAVLVGLGCSWYTWSGAISFSPQTPKPGSPESSE